MGILNKVCFQTLVKPFYSENKGLFLFIFTMMFFIVTEQSGAGLYKYHYSLVTGMLSNFNFLLFVLLIWFLYARKCAAFVSERLNNPEYCFLHVLNSTGKFKRLGLFFLVEVWLMMPILGYTIFIIFNGLQQHFYSSLIIVILYLILLCLSHAIWYIFLIKNQTTPQFLSHKRFPSLSVLTGAYYMILASFILNKQKLMWLSIKAFTCGILYLIARNNSPREYDASFTFMFFNFGILANGVLIFRIREFEETYFSFYRGLPITLFKRLVAYLFFYLLLLVPEFITIVTLTPVHLHYLDAINFLLCSYSLILVMNSITFLQNFSMKDYLKILLLLFFVEYLFLLALSLLLLSGLFLILAIVIFIKSYYEFERKFIH